jgi:hypothetical protein
MSGPAAPRRRFHELSRYGQYQARKHVDRPGAHHFAAPTPEQIEAKVPPGCRWVRDAVEAAELAAELAEVAGLGYTNGQRTRLAVYAALVDFMAPDGDGSITVGYGDLAGRASVHAGRCVARSSVGYHVRALQRAGVVLVAQSGASREALDAERDRAPTYALLAPALDADRQADEGSACLRSA